jgi:Zn finger protein HypA/HybF involved in hydrogenase expression
MHEFSLATEVIKLAEREAEKAFAISIQEIIVEV